MKADCQRFHDQLRDLGCMVCDRPTAIHHVRTKRYRTKNDWRVIPLCHDHHQGDGGIHDDPKGFEYRHGSEISLLLKAYKKIDDLYGLPDGAREQVNRIISDGFRA